LAEKPMTEEEKYRRKEIILELALAAADKMAAEDEKKASMEAEL